MDFPKNLRNDANIIPTLAGYFLQPTFICLWHMLNTTGIWETLRVYIILPCRGDDLMIVQGNNLSIHVKSIPFIEMNTLFQ